MKTYEFKSERNWDRACDSLYESENNYRFCSYGYLAITVFDELADNHLVSFCKKHRISIKEI